MNLIAALAERCDVRANIHSMRALDAAVYSLEGLVDRTRAGERFVIGSGEG